MDRTKKPVRIALQPRTEILFIERHSDGAWCLWISHDANQTTGTYIKLNNNGSVERVTLHADGSEDVLEIKPRD